MNPSTFRLTLTLVLLALLARAPALAQRVYWEPGAGSLAFEQASQLQLIFENCAPQGTPQIPAADGLDLTYAGTGSSFAMENMRVTRKVMLTYVARPTKRPQVRIPAFDVETDKGPAHVAAAAFDIGNATVGQTAIPLETAAQARLTPATGAFWAGEVFPVTYTLDLARRFRPRPPGPINWTPAPLTVEDWGEPEQFESAAGGEPRIGLNYRTRGYIAAPGTYTVPAATQDVVLVVDSNAGLFSFPFSSPQMVQHTVTSNRPILTIKPLPDGAPADFAGAVGQFTFTSKVVPTTVAVGEPVTWTLQLAGSGNWPDIHGLPAREVSRDFKVLRPQAKRTPAEGRLFDGTLTEDAVLIPTKPGSYTLEPVSYSYLDPHSGTYQTTRTEAVTVTVNPLTASSSAGTSLVAPARTVDQNAPPSTVAAVAPRLPASPAAPASIPREPLAGRSFAPVPLATLTLSLGLLASIAWLLPAWLVLAALRARRTDPLRARREARERLGRTLDCFQGATSRAARSQGLRAWQADAAVLLGIAHAAPTTASLAGLARPPAPSTQNSKPETQNLALWTALWSEADRVLYGPDDALPANWLARATSALEATRVPGWQASTLFSVRNLFPWVAAPSGKTGRTPAGGAAGTALLVIALAVLLHPRVAVAADGREPSGPPRGNAGTYSGPVAAYDAGDFAAAAGAWRAAVERDPTDWVARHNLALALAQQDHWPEAAAQWTSAFLLHPRNESVRWHLALGYQRAGYTPLGLGEFAQASGPHLLAWQASPAEWQWLLIAGGAVLAASVLLLLLRAYRRSAHRWMKHAALGAGAAAVLLLAVAIMSLVLYGDAADSRAAIVWHQVLLRSIPTEADTQQKTSSLPAGSLALVNKTFLGWVQLGFPNGQTGWVRQEDIVRLYR